MLCAREVGRIIKVGLGREGKGREYWGKEMKELIRWKREAYGRRAKLGVKRGII